MEKFSKDIFEDIKEITQNDLEEILNRELKPDFPTIKKEILKFIEILNDHQNLMISIKKSGLSRSDTDKIRNFLETKRDIIYKQFFKIQNLINTYAGRKIVMTYVFIDDDGNREIRISENDVSHLTVTTGYGPRGPYNKLSYDVNNNYKILKNSLPEKENNILQRTVKEVENRYNKYKKNILWKPFDKWIGYKLSTKGPINEAYVNFFIHEAKLLNSLEKDINTFMLDDRYGAIKADATKGYMIGDVEKNNIQYAVKGQYGSPQGIRDVINAFRKMVDSDFNESDLNNFIKKYTEDEYKRSEEKLQPQIKKINEKALDELLKEFKLDK